jgi:hypothetical protein
MHRRGFKRTAVAKFLVTGSVFFFALALVPARAQFVNPVPPPPPPVFNPSSPNTVAPPGETPVAPTLPSAPPVGSEAPSPPAVSQPIPPTTETQPQPQPPTAPSEAAPSKPTKARAARHHPSHYRWSRSRRNIIAAGPIVLGPVAAPYYYSPLGWGVGPYPCGWRRTWDGFWVRDCL